MSPNPNVPSDFIAYKYIFIFTVFGTLQTVLTIHCILESWV